MSTFRVRFSRWLLVTLLAYLTSLFLGGYWLRALHTHLAIDGWELSFFVGVVVLGQFCCAYFSPFLPAAGLRRHVFAVGVGVVAGVGLLLICYGVTMLAKPHWPA